MSLAWEVGVKSDNSDCGLVGVSVIKNIEMCAFIYKSTYLCVYRT